MAIPTYKNFMKPVLEFLADSKEHTTREIVSAISALPQCNFTSDELEQKIQLAGKVLLLDVLGGQRRILYKQV